MPWIRLGQGNGIIGHLASHFCRLLGQELQGDGYNAGTREEASCNHQKWLRTSGITAGIPVAAPLHHMDERLMHPEDRGTRWRRVMQAD